MIEFSFDNQKVTTLPIDEFMLSGRIVDANVIDTSKTWDTPHVFLDQLRGLLTQKGITYNIDPVFVSSEKAEYLADPLRIREPKNELKRWAFKRLVTRIMLGNDEVYNPAIGIGFNELGTQVTFGTDVWVCRNMSVFGNNFAQSYGKNGFDRDDFTTRLERMIDDAWRIHEANVRIFDYLRQINLTSKEGLERFVGQLALAQNAVYCGVPAHAPMNGAELNEFQKRLIKEQPQLITEDIPMSLYDVYNHCTNILTHSETNLKDKWHDINEMGEFMVEHFQLN